MSYVIGIFLIFLILLMLSPILRYRMLEAARVRLLKVIETKRGTRVIVMIHRQETLALLGFPLARYSDIHDSE